MYEATKAEETFRMESLLKKNKSHTRNWLALVKWARTMPVIQYFKIPAS